MKDVFHARVYITGSTGTTFWACQPMEAMMSREWFVLSRRSTHNTKHDPLADPLERDEWHALAWSVPLLFWFAGSDNSARPHPDRRPIAARRAMAQTRTPFLTR